MQTWSDFLTGWGTTELILSLIVRVAFSSAVFKDAAERRHTLHPDGLVFVGPMLWALATFAGGVTIAAIYWVLHHSTLTRTNDPHSSETTRRV